MREFDPGVAQSQHVAANRARNEADAKMLQAAADGHAEALNPGAVSNLQRLAGNSGVAALLNEDHSSPVYEVIGSGGAPLDSSTRDFMESRLGENFGEVRIHTGPQADASAHSINADAYTVGPDVVFREGAYQPGTQAGLRALAHELTHVVQQSQGPVDGAPAAGGIRISDPSDRFEQAAEQAAEAVVGGRESSAAQSSPRALGVQRSERDAEMEGESIQREVATGGEDQLPDDEEKMPAV